jgi:hypothetical protein
LARQHRFKQRESKLSPREFIDTLMFSEQDHSLLSLQDCCNDLNQQYQKQYSKVALHKRFDQTAVDFLKSVLGQQLANHPVVAPDCLWSFFNRILIGDSCKFSIAPELAKDYPPLYNGHHGAKALMNLQYSFDLKSGQWQYLEFTRATENDQSHSSRIMDDVQVNDLLIRDLGYVTHNYLQSIADRNAYFINRMPPKWAPLQKQNNQPIDWRSIYRKIQKHKLQFIEIDVITRESVTAIPVRLIISLVPPSVYKERLAKTEKHARQKNCRVSEEYKIRCWFNAFITNIPPGVLSARDINKVYNTRWQIELVFKTWKSLLSINKTKPVKRHRFECQLLAKFIWILLNWKIFHAVSKFILEHSPNNNCSIWKFFKQARHHSYSLRMVISRKLTFEQWSKLFIYPIVQWLLIEPKKHKIPHHQILNQAFC